MKRKSSTFGEIRICAVDPDTLLPGYAVFHGTRLVEHGVIPFRHKHRVRHAFPFFMRDLVKKTDALVIEDQFVPPGKTEIAKSIINLAVARGKIELFFDMEGKNICRVMGYRWQNEVLTSGRSRRSLKRAEADRVARMIAGQIAGGEIQNADVASAICIGSFFARLHQVHGDLAFKIAAETGYSRQVKVKKRAN